MTTRFLLLFAAFLGLSATAGAQDHARRAPHVIQLREIVVTGHVPGPVQIVLTRGPVDFSRPELQTSFVREIVRASH